MRQTLLSVLALLILFGLVSAGASFETRTAFTAFFRGANTDTSAGMLSETNDALLALVRRLNHQVVDLRHEVDVLRLELDLPLRYGHAPTGAVADGAAASFPY
jgi:hypothetical protein